VVNTVSIVHYEYEYTQHVSNTSFTAFCEAGCTLRLGGTLAFLELARNGTHACNTCKTLRAPPCVAPLLMRASTVS